MSGDIAVNHAELAARVSDVSKLTSQAAELGARIDRALTGAARVVAHPGLAAVLTQTATVGARRLVELGVLYEYIGASVGKAADGYQSSDAKAATTISSSGRPPS